MWGENKKMKLTQQHLVFYQEQKTPMPAWAYRMARERKYPWGKEQPTKLPHVNVNELINCQVDKYDRRLEAQNICRLIKNAYQLFTAPRIDPVSPQYFDLRSYMCHLAVDACSKRRTGYARKWYKKLYSK